MAQRSLRRSLGSIVLGCECLVVFLSALTLFGLKDLSPLAALGGGAVVFVALIVTIRLLRYPWSFWLGWIIQAFIFLMGFVNAALFIVGAIFGLMWAYAMIKGSRVDHNNAQLVREAAESD